MKTTVEQVKELVWDLADELNTDLIQPVVIPGQQRKETSHIYLDRCLPVKGRLYIEPYQAGYCVAPSHEANTERMTPFLIELTGEEHKRFRHPPPKRDPHKKPREPFWYIEEREDVRKAAYFFAELPYPSVPARSLTALQQNFEKQLTKALQDSSEQRRHRLANAPTQPLTTQVTTQVFLRNPDVVAEALFRANGICEACHQPAPFLRKTDATPYLEVHHIKRLADDGPDTLENVRALCPNCHRQAHFGITQ